MIIEEHGKSLAPFKIGLGEHYTMLLLGELKRFVAAYPAVLPRTIALEKRIQIGTGFHGKWYQSQREHWLGWLVVQECFALQSQRDPKKVAAKGIWNRLKCSPSMFWLAEGSSVSTEILDAAEEAAERAAKINPKDGNPHGKIMREVLPWEVIERAILQESEAVPDEKAISEANAAFDRLSELRSEYRKYRKFLVKPNHR